MLCDGSHSPEELSVLYTMSIQVYGNTSSLTFDVENVIQLTIYLGKMLNIMTSSNGKISASLAICAGNSPVPVNSPHKGQWRGALMFSLICVWINGWVNNREAGDLRRYRVHYDVIVMIINHVVNNIKNIVWTRMVNCLCVTRGLFWWLPNKHQYNTRLST